MLINKVLGSCVPGSAMEIRSLRLEAAEVGVMEAVGGYRRESRRTLGRSGHRGLTLQN